MGGLLPAPVGGVPRAVPEPGRHAIALAACGHGAGHGSGVRQREMLTAVQQWLPSPHPGRGLCP